jgi:hypothetical protein
MPERDGKPIAAGATATQCEAARKPWRDEQLPAAA